MARRAMLMAPTVTVILAAILMGAAAGGIGRGFPECVSSTQISLDNQVSCDDTACSPGYPEGACQPRTKTVGDVIYTFCGCTDGGMWDPEHGISGNCHPYLRTEDGVSEAFCTSDDNCPRPEECLWYGNTCDCF